MILAVGDLKQAHSHDHTAVSTQVTKGINGPVTDTSISRAIWDSLCSKRQLSQASCRPIYFKRAYQIVNYNDCGRWMALLLDNSISWQSNLTHLTKHSISWHSSHQAFQNNDTQWVMCFFYIYALGVLLEATKGNQGLCCIFRGVIYQEIPLQTSCNKGERQEDTQAHHS